MTPKRKYRGRLVLFLFSTLILLGNSGGERWKIVITEADEPGETLIVSGTVYAEDGVTPLEGITVYVYHTDAEGYYRKGSSSSSNPRLKGTMTTNAEGRYEFRTIRPAPYPGGRNPAHIHYVLSGDGYPKQYDELLFEGDPLHSERAQRESSAKGTFGEIRPLTSDRNGVLKCTKDVRLTQ